MASDDTTDAVRSASARDEFGTDFGRNPPVTLRVIYGLLATLPLLLPAFLFIKLYVLSITSCKVTLLAGILLGSALLSISYHQLAFATAARLRSECKPPAKSAYKGKKAEYVKAVEGHDGVVNNTAFVYSFYYNNLLFLLATPFFGVYLINDKVSGDLAFVLSVGLAGVFTLFNSKSALKAIGEN